MGGNKKIRVTAKITAFLKVREATHSFMLLVGVILAIGKQLSIVWRGNKDCVQRLSARNSVYILKVWKRERLRQTQISSEKLISCFPRPLSSAFPMGWLLVLSGRHFFNAKSIHEIIRMRSGVVNIYWFIKILFPMIAPVCGCYHLNIDDKIKSLHCT